jgi:hypothetical protein
MLAGVNVTHVESAVRRHVFVVTHVYKNSASYAIWPAVPVAVADAGTADHVRPPPLPSVTLTMLPEAFFVNIAGFSAVHRIANSLVSRSLVVGTLLAV